MDEFIELKEQEDRLALLTREEADELRNLKIEVVSAARLTFLLESKMWQKVHN